MGSPLNMHFKPNPGQHAFRYEKILYSISYTFLVFMEIFWEYFRMIYSVQNVYIEI